MASFNFVCLSHPHIRPAKITCVAYTYKCLHLKTCKMHICNLFVCMYVYLVPARNHHYLCYMYTYMFTFMNLFDVYLYVCMCVCMYVYMYLRSTVITCVYVLSH